MKRDCPLKHAAMKQPGTANAKNLSQGRACPEAAAKMALTASETTVRGSLLYSSGEIYGKTVDFLADTGTSNSFVPRELMQAL